MILCAGNMNLIPCPLCKNYAFTEIYTDPRFKGSKENQTLVQCNTCSHVYVNPYKPQDYSNVPTSVFHFDLEPNAIHRFDYFYNQFIELSNVKTGSLLEVGCGMGHFLTNARSHGWTVEGVEPSTQIAEWAINKHNLSIRNQDLLDDNFLKESYDAIVAIEVIEHLERPIENLEFIFQLLKSPGFLYITVPNFDAKKLRDDKDKSMWHEWPAMAPWGHLQYFRPGTLVPHLLRMGFSKVTTLLNNDEQLIHGCYK